MNFQVLAIKYNGSAIDGFKTENEPYITKNDFILNMKLDGYKYYIFADGENIYFDIDYETGKLIEPSPEQFKQVPTFN